MSAPDYKVAEASARSARRVAIDTVARLQDSLNALTRVLLSLRPVSIVDKSDVHEETEQNLRRIVGILQDIETEARPARKTVESLIDCIVRSTEE